MTILFAKVYLDENVDIRVAARLRHRGFCVTTARAVGFLHADDRTQLSYAAIHGYAFVTHNLREFEALHETFLSAGQIHAGIIIASTKTTSSLTDRLGRLLNRLTADEIANQILYI